MDSIYNAASSAANAAAGLVGYGQPTEEQQVEQSGQEPVSGKTGSGTAAEPYDAGNSGAAELGGEAAQNTSTTTTTSSSTSAPTFRTAAASALYNPSSQSGTEPLSGSTGAGTATEPYDAGNEAGLEGSSAASTLNKTSGQSGSEPLSGTTGAGTATEPYDAGNEAGLEGSSAAQDTFASTTGGSSSSALYTSSGQSGSEPISGLTGAGTATEPYDAGNEAGLEGSSAAQDTFISTGGSSSLGRDVQAGEYEREARPAVPSKTDSTEEVVPPSAPEKDYSPAGTTALAGSGSSQQPQVAELAETTSSSGIGSGSASGLTSDPTASSSATAVETNKPLPQTPSTDPKLGTSSSGTPTYAAAPSSAADDADDVDDGTPGKRSMKDRIKDKLASSKMKFNH